MTCSKILNNLAVKSSTAIVSFRQFRRNSASCATLCINSFSNGCMLTALLNSDRGNAEGSRTNGAICMMSFEKFVFDLIQAPCINAQSFALSIISASCTFDKGNGTAVGRKCFFSEFLSANESSIYYLNELNHFTRITWHF